MRKLRWAGTLATVVFALRATVGSVASDAPIMEIVTFDDAVERAIANNRDLQRAASAIASSEALRRKSRAAWLPNVEVFVTEAVRDSEIGFNGSVTQPKDQFALRGSVNVPIYAPAQRAATQQAGDQVDVALDSSFNVRKQVAVSAAQAYLAVIAQRRQLVVDETARDNAKAQLDFAQTRYEGGAGSKLNALRAAETLATDEALVERSKFALRLAQEALGVILAADRPVDASVEPEFDLPPPELDEQLSARTDLRLLTRQSDAADRVLRDSWKDWLPTVDASLVPSYVDPPGAFEEDRSWRAVLTAHFPIYVGGERQANRLFRLAALDAAKIELDQAQIRARSEVRLFRVGVEAATRASAQARLAAESANEVLKITEIAFRAGATTNIELIDSQRRARDSESQAARAEDLLRQAKLELLAALGRFPR